MKNQHVNELVPSVPISYNIHEPYPLHSNTCTYKKPVKKDLSMIILCKSNERLLLNYKLFSVYYML